MRLIDADYLKEKKVYSQERHEYIIPVCEIDWMPTVEPKQGEWINGRCSNCDCKRPNEYASVHSETGTRKFYPLFCWNCGARMKEGDAE